MEAIHRIQRREVLKVSVVRLADGSYTVMVAGVVGVLSATSLADAMSLAYSLATCTPLAG